MSAVVDSAREVKVDLGVGEVGVSNVKEGREHLHRRGSPSRVCVVLNTGAVQEEVSAGEGEEALGLIVVEAAVGE